MILGCERLDPVSGKWGLHPDKEHCHLANEDAAVLPKSDPLGSRYWEESWQGQTGRER